MPAFSARNARIQIEGVNILGLKWTVNTKVDSIDVSNFEGQGYADFIGGLWEADISFDAIHPGGVAAVTTIYPGYITTAASSFFLDAGTALRVDTGGAIASAAAGRGFSFPSLLIESISVDAELRSFVRFSCTAKAKGPFLFPKP